MKKSIQVVSLVCCSLLLISMSACSVFSSKGAVKTEFPTPLATFPIQPTQLDATENSPVETPLPIVITTTPSQKNTEGLASPTSEIISGASPTPQDQTATLIPAATNTGSGQILKIFLVAIDDNGKSGPLIGCGDSLIAVDVQVPQTVAVLRAALNKLLAIKSSTYGQSGLYSALYQSNMEIENLFIQDGVAYIYLAGELLQGGTCDSPRIEEQLKATALQFSTVQDVKIFINDKPLEAVLSLK
jgi:hypothetical protein